MANGRVYLSLLISVIYISGCSHHPARVVLIDTQARLIRRIRQEGQVLHPLTESVCAHGIEPPPDVDVNCPYGFHHWEPEGWVIEVWENAPVGVACVISHERKHLPVVNGVMVQDLWHKGASHHC